MTQHIQPGVYAKQSLSAHELEAVQLLADSCERAEVIDLRLLWEAIAQPSDAGNTKVLYYADGLLVGFLTLEGLGDETAEATGMVHPEYRRRGIWRALVAAAQAECQQHATAALLCYVDRRSQAAKLALEAAGGSYDMSEQKMRLVNPGAVSPITSALVIRQAYVADAPAIADILAADAGIDTTNFSQHIMLNMQLPHYQYYIAWLGNAVVGTINVQILNGEPYIYGFVVDPRYRGHGYGRQILQHTIALIAATYPHQVFLEVAPDNTTAVNLYLSCGFEVVATYDYYRIQTNTTAS